MAKKPRNTSKITTGKAKAQHHNDDVVANRRSMRITLSAIKREIRSFDGVLPDGTIIPNTRERTRIRRGFVAGAMLGVTVR